MSNTLRYTQLTARARTNAMNEVRDFAEADLAKLQEQLAELHAESYLEDTDGMALGRKTTAVTHSLNAAISFKALTDDDLALLTLLQKDTLEFLESGKLIGESVEQFECQVLDFDQYQGDWYNSYTAESKHFTYRVIKMHADSRYSIKVISKTDKQPLPLAAEAGQVNYAIRLCQEHHTNELKRTKEAAQG